MWWTSLRLSFATLHRIYQENQPYNAVLKTKCELLALFIYLTTFFTKIFSHFLLRVATSRSSGRNKKNQRNLYNRNKTFDQICGVNEDHFMSMHTHGSEWKQSLKQFLSHTIKTPLEFAAQWGFFLALREFLFATHDWSCFAQMTGYFFILVYFVFTLYYISRNYVPPSWDSPTFENQSKKIDLFICNLSVPAMKP